MARVSSDLVGRPVNGLSPSFDARQFLAQLARRGVYLVAEKGGKLIVRPAGGLSEWDKSLVAANKLAVIAELARQDVF